MLAGLLHRSIPRRASASLGLAVMLTFACERGPGDGGGPPSCVTRDTAACNPLYQPTWERVFTETIQPACGSGGSACHADANAAGAAGGLVVSDMAATHTALVDGGFVVPQDAECSELVVRLDIDDDALRMPPGSQPLDEGERCAVAQWIQQGASP